MKRDADEVVETAFNHVRQMPICRQLFPFISSSAALNIKTLHRKMCVHSSFHSDRRLPSIIRSMIWDFPPCVRGNRTGIRMKRSRFRWKYIYESGSASRRYREIKKCIRFMHNKYEKMNLSLNCSWNSWNNRARAPASFKICMLRAPLCDFDWYQKWSSNDWAHTKKKK